MRFKGQWVNRFLAAFMGGLILAVSSSCGHRPTIKTLQSDSVIVAFGDSLTKGTGADPIDSYPSVLERILRHKVINTGVSGEMSEEGLSRLPSIVHEHNPSLVILCHGGNDLLQQMDHEQIKRNLSRMIELLKSSGIDVILIGVPEPKLFHSTARLYADLAKEYDLPYGGKALNHILSNRSMKSDLIHPNAKGYRVLAESVAALMERSESSAEE